MDTVWLHCDFAWLKYCCFPPFALLGFAAMSNSAARVLPGNPPADDTPQMTSRVLADLKVLRTGTLFQRMFSAFDYKHDEWAPLRPWVLHPHSSFAMTWQIGTTLFILLSTLYIPFELAFDYVTSFETTLAAAVFHVLNPFVDVYFLIDMVLQFRVAYQDDGDLVQDSKMMALHYLKGWFVVDSVSSMAAVTVWVTDVTDYRAMRNVRFIRIFRLLKLLRVAKLKQLLVLLDGVRTELVVVSKLLKLALVTVCCAHLLACGFYMTGKQGGPGAKYEFDGSWLDAYYEKFLGMEDGKWLVLGHKDYQTVEQKYMVSLYWAFITTTTVGYGDITPITDNERAFVIFTAFAGTAIFAYITGEIAALVGEKNARRIEFDNRKRVISEFMTINDFPKELRKRVANFYDTGYYGGQFIDAKLILGDLSRALKKDVGQHMKLAAVKRSPAFKRMSQKATFELVLQLNSRQLRAGAHLVERASPADAMFLLTKGEVDVMAGEGRSNASRRRNSTTQLTVQSHGLEGGSVFGYLTTGFVFGRNKDSWAVDVVSNTDLEFYRLSRYACESLCSKYPELRAAMTSDEIALKKTHHGTNRLVGAGGALSTLHEAMTTAKQPGERRALRDSVETGASPGGHWGALRSLVKGEQELLTSQPPRKDEQSAAGKMSASMKPPQGEAQEQPSATDPIRPVTSPPTASVPSTSTPVLLLPPVLHTAGAAIGMGALVTAVREAVQQELDESMSTMVEEKLEALREELQQGMLEIREDVGVGQESELQSLRRQLRDEQQKRREAENSYRRVIGSLRKSEESRAGAPGARAKSLRITKDPAHTLGGSGSGPLAGKSYEV